jgi:hypothetical protein
MDTKSNPEQHEPKEKAFDAIRTMREIRDALSLEIMTMTYEQERNYVDMLLAQGKKQA